jgi:hypothetical protein
MKTTGTIVLYALDEFKRLKIIGASTGFMYALTTTPSGPTPEFSVACRFTS